jgi:hypothetical protein
MKRIALFIICSFLFVAIKSYAHDYPTNLSLADFTSYIAPRIPLVNERANLCALLHFNSNEDATCDFDEQVCTSLTTNSGLPRIISCKEISFVYHCRTTNEFFESSQDMAGSYNLIYSNGKITRTDSEDQIPENDIYVVDPNVKDTTVEIDLLLGMAPLKTPKDVVYLRRQFRYVYRNGWLKE